MKRSTTTALGLAAVAALALTACGGGPGEGDAAGEEGPITLTLGGWSLDSTPEFQTLADGFHAEHPDITVELRDYDATNYDTQMVADLSAGSAPDMYALKNLKTFWTYQSGGQLLDVSEVADGLGDDVGGAETYEVDGKTWAIPYRQDAWFLFYNKTLFDAAGVAYPDGSWTWDDYVDTAEQLTTALAGQGVKGTYQHNWQSIVQSFALAQTEGADLLSGDYGFLKPYYERALELQDAGAQESLGTVTTNSLTYQSQFGTQKAAMMPMGSWFVATLLAQQANGEADDFEWGFAPAPQRDASTTGTEKTPVTYGDPTSLGINPAIDDAKVQAAKDFLAYAASTDAAMAMTRIGVTPATTNDEVTESFFAQDGVPTDELSTFTFSTHEVKPENPVAAPVAAIQNILNDAHTAILSGSASIDDAIAEAESRAKSEAGIQ